MLFSRVIPVLVAGIAFAASATDAAVSGIALADFVAKARPDTALGDAAAGRAAAGRMPALPDQAALLVRTGAEYAWPGVELRFPDGPRDLSGAGMLRVIVSNACEKAYMVHAMLRTGADQGRSPSGCATLRPGAVREIAIPLRNIPWVLSAPLDLPGMRQKPGTADSTTYDLSACSGIDVYRVQTSRKEAVSFAVLSVSFGENPVAPAVLDAATFFPFVDRFGQFRHADWPLKIHSDEELAAAAACEEAWLAAHAGSPIPDADRYGGWAGGPQLEATGYFRTEKLGGTWWLVDPEGHLFFSHGIACVYADTPTPVTGREHFFEWLPERGDPLFCGWVARADGRLNIDFAQINQKRKWGADWKPRFADLAARRCLAWGVNTMGNWTTDYAWAPRRVPYTVWIHSRSFPHKLPIARKGFGDRLPDVFHPDYPAFIRARAADMAAKVADDPMCLGVFVDNELAWDTAEDPAAYAETYFGIVEAAVREAFPHHLYLGCRFAWGGEDVWRVAARHCDVVSVNFYERAPARDLPPGAEDKPLLIGEYHFGSLDSGMFGGGLVTVFDQKERGDAYRSFVRDCLDHPRFVGCHWFQWQDQALTGRPDGEDYACGFVTACDVPYPELVRAARDIAVEMYPRRFHRE